MKSVLLAVLVAVTTVTSAFAFAAPDTDAVKDGQKTEFCRFRC